MTGPRLAPPLRPARGIADAPEDGEARLDHRHGREGLGATAGRVVGKPLACEMARTLRWAEQPRAEQER